METALFRVAGIGSADVVVIALSQPLVDTESRFAVVPRGTLVAIIAIGFVGFEKTTLLSPARIVSTGVSVVTNQGHAGHTAGIWRTYLHAITGIIVVAIEWRSRETAHLGIATLYSVAKVAIITIQVRATLTDSFCTGICRGAHIAVSAIGGVVLICTAAIGIAEVISAEVSIVAVCCRTTLADTRRTGVSDSAGITVCAEESVVSRGKATVASRPIADRAQADGSHSLGSGAIHDGLVVNATLIRQRPGITIERTIAEITIFQGPAIIARFAVATDANTDATSSVTLICYSTGVAVVAIRTVVLIETATHFVAVIVSARVVVIAIHRLPDADPRIAMVSNRTWVAVKTLPLGQRRMATAGVAIAKVVGAWIAIITEAQVFVVLQDSFINIAITIIVEPITAFPHGHGCVTKSKTVGTTHPFTFAEPKLILRCAGGPERQFNGSLGAGANSRIGNALLCVNPVDCDCCQT